MEQKLTEPFTQIPNSMIQGNIIKEPAVIALYCFLRSHSVGFSYNWNNVKKSLTIGKSKYYESLKTLEKIGYIKTQQTKNKNGQFGNTKVSIYGRDYNTLPCTDLPHTAKRDTAEPYTANQHYNNIKPNNKNINNSERESEKNNLTHFDFLKLNYENEVDILSKEYKPKIEHWGLFIEKFNEYDHTKKLTPTLFKDWLIRERPVKNNNVSNTENEQPKQKIGGF